MNTQTIVASKNASPKLLLSVRILTVVMAAIWVFFGFGFIVRTQQVRDNLHHLGYPLYLTYVIGTTHILGGLGLLIPNRPRLSQWVFAGLTYDLLLASISYIASHDTWGERASSDRASLCPHRAHDSASPDRRQSLVVALATKTFGSLASHGVQSRSGYEKGRA